MPTGPRIRANNVYGVTTNNPLTIGGTTLNSTGLSILPVVASAHAVIVLDPKRVFGEPEIVVVTSHTSGNTAATITRGQYGTSARSHPQGTAWAHIAIDEDYIKIVTSLTRPSNPYMGQLIFETDTIEFRFWNGSNWLEISTGSGGGGGGPDALAYSQVNTPQGSITSEVDLTGLTATVTVPEGRQVRITGVVLWTNTGTSGIARLRLKEGGTQIAVADEPVAGTGGLGFTSIVSAVISPSAGAHTYKLTGQHTAGTGTLAADTAIPAYILVEDITTSETPFSDSSVPVGQLAYAPMTTGQSGITTVTDVTGCSLNISVPAGRVVRLTARAHVQSNVAGDGVLMWIKEGATNLQAAVWTLRNASQSETNEVSVILSPSAGSHTYKMTMERASGTGSLTVEGSSQYPVFLLAEDITPTPAPSSGAPGSTLGYAEVVTNQGSITTTETDLTGLAVTVTVPAGRRIRIRVEGLFQSTVANDLAYLRIKEGSTIYQISSMALLSADAMKKTGEVIITPPAGTHTYKATLARTSGSGNISLVAGATFPAYILVEDITGSVWPEGSAVTAGMVASEAWTDYVPTLTQGVTVTKTVAYARYFKVGRLVTVQADLSITGAGTAGQYIEVGLPVLPAATSNEIGLGWVFDASASALYKGTIAEISGSQIFRFRSFTSTAAGSFLGADVMSAALASGDVIRFTATYEAAS